MWSGVPHNIDATHDDVRLVSILSRKLGPDTSELIVGRTSLTDNLAVPPGIVVLTDLSDRRRDLDA